MSLLLWLVAIAAAVVLSLVCSFVALGALAGPDIGYAGAGLWYLVMPGAVIGLVVAAVVTPFAARKVPFARTLFLFFTAAFSAIGGTLPMGLFKWEMKKQQETTLVYVPAPDYAASLEIALPEHVLVGQPIAAEATYREGPWQRVANADFLRNPATYARYRNPTRTDQPPAVSNDIAGELDWNPQDLVVSEIDPVDKRVRLSFRKPGTYAVYAVAGRTLEVKSNVVKVTVLTSEFVYVPAAGYSAALQIDGPPEAVMSQPYVAKATVKHGPWERIRFQDLKLERFRKFADSWRQEHPPALDSFATGTVAWSVDPPSYLGQAYGPEARIYFKTTGPVQVRALMGSPEAPIGSNVLTVTVREK